MSDFDAVLTAEMLRPHIAAQASRVSIRRTDALEIARIMAIGAYGTDAHSLIEQGISAEIPQAVFDRQLVAELKLEEARLIAAGYSLTELARNPRLALRGGGHAALADIGTALEVAYADVNRRSAAVDAVVDAWYAQHVEEIYAIALDEATTLLAQRQASVGGASA